METAYIGAFADGEFRFHLPMARLVAAEREADCSIFELFQNLGEHLGAVADEMVLAGPSPARLRQCHALIRNALIGGGTDEVEAKELIETYCYPARPAIHDMALAWSILKAAIYGVELKKKAEGAETDAPSASPKAG